MAAGRVDDRLHKSTAMSEESVDGAALDAAPDDPDNPPRTPETAARLDRVPDVKAIRRALRLTQDEFSARFRIPLGTLRDWEQGKSEPGHAARAYLTVIAHDPEAVHRALEMPPQQQSNDEP